MLFIFSESSYKSGHDRSRKHQRNGWCAQVSGCRSLLSGYCSESHVYGATDRFDVDGDTEYSPWRDRSCSHLVLQFLCTADDIRGRFILWFLHKSNGRVTEAAEEDFVLSVWQDCNWIEIKRNIMQTDSIDFLYHFCQC